MSHCPLHRPPAHTPRPASHQPRSPSLTCRACTHSTYRWMTTCTSPTPPPLPPLPPPRPSPPAIPVPWTHWIPAPPTATWAPAGCCTASCARGSSFTSLTLSATQSHTRRRSPTCASSAARPSNAPATCRSVPSALNNVVVPLNNCSAPVTARVRWLGIHAQSVRINNASQNHTSSKVVLCSQGQRSISPLLQIEGVDMPCFISYACLKLRL